MGATPDLIQNILDRLDRLEQNPASPSEQLTPNYLTVNPDGTVGADFTGHISAQGIDLPEAPGNTFQPVSAVDWEDTAGAIRSYIQGVAATGSGHALYLQAGATPAHVAALELIDDETGNPAAVVAAAQPNGSAANALTIVNGNGASSFLQLAGGVAQLELAIGTISLAFAASQSASAVITHNLGRVPQWFTAFRNGNPSRDMTLGIGTLTATQMTLHGWTDTAASVNPTFVWLAIG